MRIRILYMSWENFPELASERVSAQYILLNQTAVRLKPSTGFTFYATVYTVGDTSVKWMMHRKIHVRAHLVDSADITSLGDDDLGGEFALLDSGRLA
jgi:hypothetical protein